MAIDIDLTTTPTRVELSRRLSRLAVDVELIRREVVCLGCKVRCEQLPRV